MKGGKTPIHLMRFACADYLNEPAVKLALAEDNVDASAFYPLFLFNAFTQGGSLPSGPRILAATVGMPLKRVERALKFWQEHGVIEERDGRLYQKRLEREVTQELAFRDSEAERKRIARERQSGGRPADGGQASGGRRPESEAPTPAPAPLPAPNAVRQSPAPLPATTNGHGATSLPPGQREDDRTEAAIKARKVAQERYLLRLVGRLEPLDPKGRDPSQLMALVTSYDKPDGRRVGGCVNPATLSYERVEKSVEDAEALLKEWGGTLDVARP